MRLSDSLGRYERKQKPKVNLDRVVLGIFLVLTVLGGSFAVFAAPSASTILGPGYLTFQGLVANPAVSDGSFWHRSDNGTIMMKNANGIANLYPLSTNAIGNFQITNQKIGVADVNYTQLASGITQTSVSYTVYSSGGTYYARNGETGTIDYSGAVAHTVINNVLGALTAGRTWKEKVVLKGAFTITNTINVPSHTILENLGSVTLGAAVNKDMFRNSDWAAGNTEIAIIGGTIDGNRANQASDGVGISFKGVVNSYINSVKVKSCYKQGILFQESTVGSITCDNNVIDKCIFTDNGSAAIRFVVDASLASIMGNKRNVIIACSFSDNNKVSVTEYGAIHLDEHSQGCVVSTCVFNNEKSTVEIDGAYCNVVELCTVDTTSSSAIILYQGVGASDLAATRNTIIGNTITGASKAAILVTGSGAVNKPYWNLIAMNTIKSSGPGAAYPWGTIALEDSFECTVIGNVLSELNANSDAITAYGGATCGSHIILENYCDGARINIRTNADNCTVTENTIANSAIAAIVVSILAIAYLRSRRKSVRHTVTSEGHRMHFGHHASDVSHDSEP